MSHIVSIALGCLFALSFGATEAAASRMAAPLDLPQGIGSAEFIVYAQAVSEATSTGEDRSGMVEKDVVVQVKAVVKGTVPGSTITVTVPAWSPGGPRMLDGPTLAEVVPGRSYLLLLKANEAAPGYLLASKHGDTLNLAVPASAELDPGELEGVTPEVAAAKSLLSCFRIGDATLAEQAIGDVDRETNSGQAFLNEDAQQVLHEGLKAAFDNSRPGILHDYTALALCHLGDTRAATDAVRILSDGNNNLWSRAGGAVAALMDRTGGASLCGSAVEAARKGRGYRHPRLMESFVRNCPEADLGDEIVRMMSNIYPMYSVINILSKKKGKLTPAQKEQMRAKAFEALDQRDDPGAVRLLRVLGDPAAIPDLERSLERIRNKDFGTRHSTKETLVDTITEALDELRGIQDASER